MQKAHPTFSFARKSSLREASRAGRFSKRWHLSRQGPSRPQPPTGGTRLRLKSIDGNKM